VDEEKRGTDGGLNKRGVYAIDGRKNAMTNSKSD